MTLETILQLATLAALGLGFARLSFQFGRHAERVEQLAADVSELKEWKDDVDKDLRRKALHPGFNFPLAPGP